MRKIYVILAILILFVTASYCNAESGYTFGELNKLADKYGTDKRSEVHGYADVYERLFFPIKDSAKRIFEIGVETGASLKMFRDYFPHATIYGIDIVDTSHLDSDRIKTFVADQESRDWLKNFIDMYGSDFDVILDDGGHSMRQQQVSFGYLFRHLKPGGFYIIEDVHTSKKPHGVYGVNFFTRNTTLRMINIFIDNGTIKSRYMTKEEGQYAASQIEYCLLLSKDNGWSISCVFKKKSQDN